MDVQTNQRFTNLERDVSDLRARTNRMPVREAKVAFSYSVTVYKFEHCTDADRTLYLDNPEIETHLDSLFKVAAIRIDGVAEYWRLVGVARQCKTGACAEILSWWRSCDERPCYNLTPCGGGSPIVVRGLDWSDYDEWVVKLDGPGVEGCYDVTAAEGCFDINEEVTVAHITAKYRNCDGCGCYELTGCADSAVIWVDDDLAKLFGVDAAIDSIGKFVKYKGVCYQVTAFANPCGTEPIHWGYDWALCGFGLLDPFDCPREVNGCDNCCYLLTPCEGQEGDPEPKYVRIAAGGDFNPDEFVTEEGESNGRVVMLDDEICYAVSIPDTCVGVVSMPTVLEEFESCEECKITCWERCDAPGTYLKTYSNLSDVPANPAAVKRAEDGYCYKRAEDEECEELEAVIFTVEIIIEEGEESCEICQDPKVKLTPSCGGCSTCSNESGGSDPESSTIITDDESLFPHVGKYVKVEGVCYLVEWATESVTQEEVCWTGPFDDCGSCRGGTTKLTVIALRGGVHKHVQIEFSGNVCEVGDWDGDCDE